MNEIEKIKNNKSVVGTVNNHHVLSLYQSTDGNKAFLRALKGESELMVNRSELDRFINNSVIYAWNHLKNMKFDYIICGQNTYYFFDQFITRLFYKFSSNSLKLSNSLYKTNTQYLRLNNHVPDDLKPEVDKLLFSLKTKDTIKLRNDIPVKFRRYFSGFISIDKDIQYKIQGKKILVIDDILTTGSTFSEVFSILGNVNTKSFAGLSVFKFIA